ncbi:MAG TPA: hypothetical protein VN740_05005 [Solirubrobacteraceae bacterium]|nr:hypothetical protein [Solirubrobacteraceae bacterium]
MYQFSRGIYRELSPLVDRSHAGRSQFAVQLALLRACETSIERLATDRHYFAHPARTLFGDIRCYFPVCRQEQVYQVVERYIMLADEFVAALPPNGVDHNGNPLQCRAVTRKGTACQRAPLPLNGYCPSHQHLAETENCEVPALAA